MCKLFLRAASAGLRLHTAEAQSIDEDVKIIDKSQPGSISIGMLQANTKTNIIIPYSVDTDLREISVRALVEYATPDGDFAFACNAKVPIVLPLAIGVQDLFKEATLVSKFTIGTSSGVPVRILECHLEGNSEYRVSSPTWPNEALDLFVRQPLSLVSKIYPNSENPRDSKPAPTKLFLKVKYRCLDDIIYAAVEHHFLTALDVTPYRMFCRVLAPALVAALKTRVEAQDLEAICLRRGFNMGVFDEWAWKTLFAGLPCEDSQGLEKWLRGWHEVRGFILECATD